MCECQKFKIGSMKRHRKHSKSGGRKHRRHRMGALTGMGSTIVDCALGVGGAVAAQEIGSFIPASTTMPWLSSAVDAAKIVLPAVVVSMMASGSTKEKARAIAIGMAAQGGLNLANVYVFNKPTARIGYPINANGLSGQRTGRSPGYPLGTSGGGLAGTSRRGVAGGVGSAM